MNISEFSTSPVATALPAVGNVVLHLKVKTQYVPILIIPKSEIPRCALKPYKWLGFLGFIIFGREDFPGFLATAPNGGPISAEVIESATLQHDQVYYISPTEQSRFVDPHNPRKRNGSQSISAQSSSRRSTPAINGAKGRDEKRCAITGEFKPQACHLIPRAKGNSYIKHITQYSSSPFDEVDDVRNLIYLLSLGHTALDDRDLAFLKTPNVFFKREDIPKPHLPGINNRPLDGNDPTHLTLQYFAPDELMVRALQILAPNNVNLWQPTNKDRWPTDTIFNFVYASTVLNRWLDPTSLFVEEARVDYDRIAEELNQERKHQEEERRRDAQKQACITRAERHGENSKAGLNNQNEQSNQDQDDMGNKMLEDEGDSTVDTSNAFVKDEESTAKVKDFKDFLVDYVLMKMRSQHEVKSSSESLSSDEKVRIWREGLASPSLEKV